MGFQRTKADSEVWMRRAGDLYEYLGVWVDDLAIVSKDPEAITKTLMETYKFHLKGVGPLEHHLGCDYVRNSDGTLSYTPKKYITRMLENYGKLFELPKGKPPTPLEKNDHPELDDSAYCTDTERGLYWSIIGSLQWLISLGRFDIQCATMTLAGFRTLPRIGHLQRAKRVMN